MEREMCTVRRIAQKRPIINADKLELVIIDGWQVIVRKDEFEEDEKVAYFEIDSWIPHKIAPFLSKGKEPNIYNGIKGERLRSIKLRGEISQGLVLHLADLNVDPTVYTDRDCLDDLLNITKWEKPIPASLQGKVKGNFPSFLKKTDQERIQNIYHKLSSYPKGQYEITGKLDGSSMTVYLTENGKFGICSRNLDLEDTEDNLYWKVAKEYKLESIIRKIKDNRTDFIKGLALQGELVGPGVQGNIHGFHKHRFMLFDIWDIQSSSYVDAFTRLSISDCFGLEIAPIFGVFELNEKDTIDFYLNVADDAYNYGLGKIPNIEGLVYKSIESPNISFKVISNQYLLRHE